MHYTSRLEFRMIRNLPSYDLFSVVDLSICDNLSDLTCFSIRYRCSSTVSGLLFLRAGILARLLQQIPLKRIISAGFKPMPSLNPTPGLESLGSRKKKQKKTKNIALGLISELGTCIDCV